MRNRYIVAYDVSDAKRLRQTHKKMNGFGEPLQYSVFSCDLSPKERVIMEETLTEIINLKEDRILIIDTGAAEGKARRRPQDAGQAAKAGGQGSHGGLIPTTLPSPRRARRLLRSYARVRHSPRSQSGGDRERPGHLSKRLAPDMAAMFDADEDMM